MTSKSDIEKQNQIAIDRQRRTSAKSMKEVLQLRKSTPYRGFIDVRPVFDEPLTLFCNNDDLIALQLFWRDDFEVEPGSLRLWSELARKSTRICDVGTHVGIYSLVAAQANRKSKVFSFEAIDYIFARLVVNVLANGLGNITHENLGVSSRDGRAEVNVKFGPGILSAGSSLENREALTETAKPQRIGIVSLDSYFDGMKLDLIKIDVEGHELEVLKGAERVLTVDRPIILCEILQATEKGAESYALMQNKGYSCFSIDETGGKHVGIGSAEGLSNAGPNYLFVPSEKVESLLNPLNLQA